jgi:hypothetical protein
MIGSFRASGFSVRPRPREPRAGVLPGSLPSALVGSRVRESDLLWRMYATCRVAGRELREAARRGIPAVPRLRWPCNHWQTLAVRETW